MCKYVWLIEIFWNRGWSELLLHDDLQISDWMVIWFLKGKTPKSHCYGGMYSLFEESEYLNYITFEDKTTTTIYLFGQQDLLILLSQSMDIAKFSHGYWRSNETHLSLLFSFSKGLPNSGYQFGVYYIENLTLWIVERIYDFLWW